MNFQQLRTLHEAVRCRCNLAEAALALHISQSAVGRQIRELETELGIIIFHRSGKRLVGLTEAGGHVMPMVDRLVEESRNLSRASREFITQSTGRFSIAATHSQARYAMPAAVSEFTSRYPGVQLSLHQGSARQVADMVESGEADIGIATEVLGQREGLLALPARRWNHAVIVPPGHALLQAPLTLKRLAQYPLITYESGYSSRASIDRAFDAAELAPEVVLIAMDADVIKTYVALGLGVGIVASIALDPSRDARLAAIDAGPLFGEQLTRMAVRRGNYLREYVYSFIGTFAPQLTREVVERARRKAHDESREP